jgi:hypothetical protein
MSRSVSNNVMGEPWCWAWGQDGWEASRLSGPHLLITPCWNNGCVCCLCCSVCEGRRAAMVSTHNAVRTSFLAALVLPSNWRLRMTQDILSGCAEPHFTGIDGCQKETSPEFLLGEVSHCSPDQSGQCEEAQMCSKHNRKQPDRQMDKCGQSKAHRHHWVTWRDSSGGPGRKGMGLLSHHAPQQSLMFALSPAAHVLTTMTSQEPPFRLAASLATGLRISLPESHGAGFLRTMLWKLELMTELRGKMKGTVRVKGRRRLAAGQGPLAPGT